MKYSTRHEEKRRYRLACLLMILAVAVGVVWNMMEAAGAEKDWDVCYEMANQHIEWSWAGKN